MWRITIFIPTFIFLIPFITYADIDSDLLVAARKGDISAVISLLDKGANIETRNVPDGNHGYNSGFTPLMFAVDNGYKNVVKELLKKGANANARGTDESHTTPASLLDIATRKDDKDLDLDIIKSLIEYGADINSDHRILLASAYGRFELVKLFLENGAKVNFSDGNNAL